MTKHHGVVALISRCEAAGLVQRRASQGNQRRVEVTLTPAGEQYLERLGRLHRDELYLVKGRFAAHGIADEPPKA